MFCASGLFYQEALALLVEQRAVSTYLEIGVQEGLNISQIKVKTAVGVDPNFLLSHNVAKGKEALHLYQMTSDRFFAEDKIFSDFDFVFLDGLHQVEYLLRDFYNAERRCKANGLIVMHDCLPYNSAIAARKEVAGHWTGDVWKIVPILKQYRPDLEVVLLDAAPTGLICVSNLDPKSTVLEQGYLSIVKNALAEPNDEAALMKFYENHHPVSTQAVLEPFEQSRHFKT